MSFHDTSTPQPSDRTKELQAMRPSANPDIDIQLSHHDDSSRKRKSTITSSSFDDSVQLNRSE